MGSVKKSGIYKFTDIVGKIPVLESVFDVFPDLRVCNFITKKLLHRCFPVTLAKFLRKPFLTGHLRWMLLYHCEMDLIV